MIIEILGIRMYALGLYTACGALCAAAAVAVLCASLGMKRGSAPVIFLLSALGGLVFSRLAFCLACRVSGKMIPLSLWPRVTGGGWSLAGLIGGAFAGGLAAARLTGEKTGRVLDILSCALLPLIAAERMGEARISGGSSDAVFYWTTAGALLLFAALLVLLARRREADGLMTAVFLLSGGAGAVVTESLRTEGFLLLGPLSLLQAAGIVMLISGAAAVLFRIRKNKNAVRAD